MVWLKVEGSGPDCDTEADDPRVTFLVATAVAPVGDPPYGLGTHPASVGSSIFNQWITEFQTEVGTPAYVNCFVAYDPDFSNWGNEAYTAAQSLSQDSVGKYCIPVLGIPMAKNSNFGPPANQTDFNAWVAGTYDTYLTAAVQNYLQFFDELHIRPGYEMNGTFMPWFWGGQNGDTVTGPLWLSAFKHIVTTARAAAAAVSTTAKPKKLVVTWNPCHQNNNAGNDPRNMYPGNAYCDYVGLDLYSPLYTEDSSANFSGDGVVYSGTDTQKRVAQALNPLNRIHYYDYPGATSSNATGGTSGWGMQDNIAFCMAQGVPLAFPECGSGQDFADQGKGPAEDYVFPFYLRSRCDQAVANGVPVLYLNIWSADEADGGWGYMFRQKNKCAQAWASAFGGTGAALRYNFGGGSSGSTTGSASSGSTGSTSSGSTGSTTAGPASIAITDTAGHSKTLSLPATPVVNNHPNGYNWQTFFATDTGLLTNVNYFQGGDGNLYVDADDDSKIASAVLTKNGLNVVSLMPAGSSGPASAVVTDTNSKSATLSLPNPPQTNNGTFQTFYGSDTGLLTNVNWFVGTDGSLILDGSSDGSIGSVAVTKNGVPVVSLMPNTTYN